MLIGSEPAVALDCRQNLAESILWDDRTQRLWWVDIHAGDVWSWDPFGTDAPAQLPLGRRIGAIGLAQDGYLIAGMERGFALIDTHSGALVPVCDLPQMAAGVRLNDGRVDPAGRFICGGMHEGNPQQPLADLLVLDADLSLRKMFGAIHCTNSLCWSPDGRKMYFTDMPSRRIEQFDYDPSTGTALHRRDFATLAQTGLPDGSVTDAEGHLWNAEWGGGRLVRYAPDGTPTRDIPLPVSNPTCMTFGGPDLDILFVTTAWFGLDPARRSDEPHAGSILALRPGVRGRPEYRFAGNVEPIANAIGEIA